MQSAESAYRDFPKEAERFMRESASAAAAGAKKYSFIYGMMYNKDGGVIVPLDIMDGPIMWKAWMQEYLEKNGISGAVYTIEKKRRSDSVYGYYLKIETGLNGKKMHERKSESAPYVIATICLCVCVLLSCYFAGRNKKASADAAEESGISHVAEQAKYSQPPDYSTYLPPPEAFPVLIMNGEIVKEPTTECVAPLEVVTSGDGGYYIYLKSVKPPFGSSIGFYVAGGKSIEISVPVGEFEIYYATGETWRGEDALFGSDTQYYKCDSTFEFSEDTDGYTGWTLELFGHPNGNLDVEEISSNRFPT